MRSLSMLIVGLMCLSPFGAGRAAEMTALASGATRDAVEELTSQFEKSTGSKLIFAWAGSVDIRKKVSGGEVYDVVIASGPDIDAFIKDGKLAPGSRVDLMKSGMGVAVRKGAPKPDIQNSGTFKAALVAAKSIGYSSGPSGTALESMLKRMGIFEQVSGNMKQAPSGVAVGSLIADGQADIGVQQISEMIHYPGIDYLGPLPPDLQTTTQFSAGVSAHAKEPETAGKFLKFLASPEAAGAIRHQGMEPG